MTTLTHTDIERMPLPDLLAAAGVQAIEAVTPLDRRGFLGAATKYGDGCGWVIITQTGLAEELRDVAVRKLLSYLAGLAPDIRITFELTIQPEVTP